MIKNSILIGAAVAAMAFGQAPSVQTDRQTTLMVVEAPDSASARFESMAAQYDLKAAMYRKRAENVPAYARILNDAHVMAPGTKAHSLHFAEKYEAKAKAAREMAAQLAASAEMAVRATE